MFTVNLPLKLFRATVANADIESPKSLHTFLKMFVPQASEIWTNSYGQNRQNYTNFWPFWQKMFCFVFVFLNHFWQSVDAILEDVSVAETIIECSTINMKTIPPFSIPKITVVRHV